jgi:hypothetical protein
MSAQYDDLLSKYNELLYRFNTLAQSHENFYKPIETDTSQKLLKTSSS